MQYDEIGKHKIYNIIEIEKIIGDKIDFGSQCHYKGLVVVVDKNIINNWSLHKKIWNELVKKYPFDDEATPDQQIKWDDKLNRKLRKKFLKEKSK